MTQPRQSASCQPNQHSRLYKNYVLTLLTLTYFLYLVDRSAIMVTQEAIKAEFRLTDTQMGMITGTALGVSYAIAGLPMGWLVDKVNRRNLLATILACWSGLTAVCGTSTAYAHLLLARVGIGASEAGASPASLSMLGDIFPPERRATAMSIFFSGTMFGIVASFLLGGLIAHEFGWRMVFLAFGIPGIILALIILFTVREPPRKVTVSCSKEQRPGLLSTISFLLGGRILGPVYLGAVLYCLATASVGTWIVPFLMREHRLDIASAGATVALVQGVGGVIGGVGLGALADHLARRNASAPAVLLAIAALLNVAAGILLLNAVDFSGMMAGMAVFGLTGNAYAGISTAMIAASAPHRSHGIAFALYALLANLIGAGVGPVAVGLISDSVRGGGLSFGMQCLLLANLPAALIFAQVGSRMDKAQKAFAPGAEPPSTPKRIYDER